MPNKTTINILDILSILVSLVSLIIAFASLKISKDAIALSSQVFVPRITFEIEEDGLRISNKDSDIFDVYMVSLTKINTVGYWDNQLNGRILIPFITESHSFGDGFLHIPLKANEYFKFDTYTDYYSDETFDIVEYQDIYDYITTTYDYDSELGYTTPLDFNTRYYLCITYFNQFNEIKELYFAQTHIHGGGEFKRVISEEDYLSCLEEANHPEFDSLQKSLQYFNTRFITQY